MTLFYNVTIFIQFIIENNILEFVMGSFLLTDIFLTINTAEKKTKTTIRKIFFNEFYYPFTTAPSKILK